MKKILIIINFILLFLIPIEVFAEETEIDCANNPYACVKCYYGEKFHFTVYSDGQKIYLDINDYDDPPGTQSDFSNIISNNFKLDSENKLFCPNILYYNLESLPMGLKYVYTFNRTENFKIKKKDEENNGKKIFTSEKKNS